jgi:signal transduction histidine kinase
VSRSRRRRLRGPAGGGGSAAVRVARLGRRAAAPVAGLAARAAVQLGRLESPGPRVSAWRALLAAPLAAALWALAILQVAGVRGVVPAFGAVGLVTGMHTMPLVWSRRYPLAAWAPVTLAASIMLGSFPVWPLACVAAMLAALYMVGVHSDRRTGLAATVISVAAILPMLGNRSFAATPALLPLIVLGFVAVLAFANNVKTRRAAEHALAEREEEHRQEQARRALLEERSRIARELHDVVAHHMSMIAVQAETAPYRIDGLPEAGARDFAAISATAREALTEMRRLLGVLRSESAEVDRAPQPGLERLGELVDGARKAGLPVRLEVHGPPRPLPTGVDLSAYRIVQEALSNAGRHARGSNVEVEVSYGKDRVEVTVTDDGHGAATARDGRAAQRGSAPQRGGAGDGPARGHGLLGMSERVAMLGGSLQAGPLPQGGFQVHASLPVEPAEER